MNFTSSGAEYFEPDYGYEGFGHLPSDRDSLALHRERLGGTGHVENMNIRAAMSSEAILAQNVHGHDFHPVDTYRSQSGLEPPIASLEPTCSGCGVTFINEYYYHEHFAECPAIGPHGHGHDMTQLHDVGLNFGGINDSFILRGGNDRGGRNLKGRGHQAGPRIGTGIVGVGPDHRLGLGTGFMQSPRSMNPQSPYPSAEFGLLSTAPSPADFMHSQVHGHAIAHRPQGRHPAVPMLGLGLPHAPAPVTLFYGGAVRADSLVGGCSWLLVDTKGATIASGSYSVVQTFPSLSRLEFEGLLNGLQAAFLKQMTHVLVRGASPLIQAYFSRDHPASPPCPFLSVIYQNVQDLNTAIRKLLPRFRYEFELITAAENLFAQRLASNVISEYHRKRDMKVARQLSTGGAQQSSLSGKSQGQIDPNDPMGFSPEQGADKILAKLWADDEEKDSLEEERKQQQAIGRFISTDALTDRHDIARGHANSVDSGDITTYSMTPSSTHTSTVSPRETSSYPVTPASPGTDRDTERPDNRFSRMPFSTPLNLTSPITPSTGEGMTSRATSVANSAKSLFMHSPILSPYTPDKANDKDSSENKLQPSGEAKEPESPFTSRVGSFSGLGMGLGLGSRLWM